MSLLTNLQDARSCAATGFEWVSFSLERGHDRKLPPTMVKDIVGWISGPKIWIETNLPSLEELKLLDESVEVYGIVLPVSDWNELLLATYDRIIIRAGGSEEVAKLQQILQAAEQQEKSVYIELMLDEIAELARFQEILPHSLVNLPNIELAKELLAHPSLKPLGFSFREEAIEKGYDCLDYEKIDEFVENLVHCNIKQ